MKVWKGNWNATTLLFSRKGFEILHQVSRGQVKSIVMEYYNGIFFHMPWPEKHITYLSINCHFPVSFKSFVERSGYLGSCKPHIYYWLTLRLMEPGGSMPHSQGLSDNIYPDSNQTQFLVLIPISLRSILILSSHLRQGLREGLFPAGVLLKFWKHSCLLPFWLYGLPISVF